jgi:beta-lactam-binding protein with PASTA domain
VECTDPSLNNTVKSQDPAPGSQVDQGSFVNIVVLKFRPSDPSCVSPPPT